MVFNKEHFTGIIKREHIDPLILTIISSKNPVEYIAAAVKLIVYLAYVAMVYMMWKTEAESKKQEYEQKQTLGNASTVDDPVGTVSKEELDG